MPVSTDLLSFDSLIQDRLPLVDDGRRHRLNHGAGEPGIDAQKDAAPRDHFGDGERAHDSVFHVLVCRLPEQIPREEPTVTDLASVECPAQHR